MNKVRDIDFYFLAMGTCIIYPLGVVCSNLHCTMVWLMVSCTNFYWKEVAKNVDDDRHNL